MRWLAVRLLGVPLERQEPLALVALALHGVAVLLVAGHQAWQWAPLALVAGLGLAGLLRPVARPGAVAARAAVTLAVAFAMQAFAPEGGFFLLWLFVIVAIYPSRLQPVAGLALGTAAAASYLLLIPLDATDGPGGVAVLRAVCLLLIALVVAGTMQALREATSARDRAAAQLNAVFDAVPAGLALYDADHRFVRLNDQLAAVNGIPREAHVGRRIEELLPNLPPAATAGVDHVWRTGAPLLDVRIVGRTPATGDEERTWNASFFPVRVHGELRAAGIVVTDVTSRQRAERDLAWSATHDALTRLPNRVLFGDRLTVALGARRRPGEHVAVLLLDVDRFKVVNDSLGHPAGDALLQVLAGRLAAAVREGDTVARLGGDEFAVLCDGGGGLQAAEDVARRLLRTTAAPIDVGGRQLRTSLSVGIALDAEAGADPDALLRAADAALYAAKDAGRSRYAVFDQRMRTVAAARLGLEQALRTALARAAVDVAYQPIVSLRDGRVSHVEALVRWTHETAPVPAADVAALADDLGLQRALGRAMLAAACADAARWNGGARPRVSVNVGADHLDDPGFVGDVLEALERTGLSPARLCLELTESALVRNFEAVLGRLRQLREIGVQLALDDFGTGWSSLAYLRRLPMDLVKLDRSFMADLRGGAPAITAATVSLARAFGAAVVAEGVEDLAELRALRAVGCDLAQGYAIARPAAATELDLTATAREAPAAAAADGA